MTPQTSTPPAHHGAFDYAELARLGLNPDNVVDFSVNSNPFGPSPTVRPAISAAPLDRYPDRDCHELRQALAARHTLSADEIVVGNGTAELLWLIAFTVLRAGDTAMILAPTFGEYARVAQLMGARVSTWWSPDAFRDPAAEIRASQPRILFCCNPNNPTGHVIPTSEISAWAEANPRTLFVIDEAYAAFAPHFESAISLRLPNLLVVRSMTKDYALAALRLGYVVGPTQLISAVANPRPAWNVNGLAQAAGLAALADEGYLQSCLVQLAAAKVDLITGLERLGYRPRPSQTHFFIMRVGEAAAFRLRLLRQHLLVRDCASFGLPHHIRIATRRPEENGRLLHALAAIQKESGGE